MKSRCGFCARRAGRSVPLRLTQLLAVPDADQPAERYSGLFLPPAGKGMIAVIQAPAVTSLTFGGSRSSGRAAAGKGSRNVNPQPLAVCPKVEIQRSRRP
jgi:hypothetical protein